MVIDYNERLSTKYWTGEHETHSDLGMRITQFSCKLDNATKRWLARPKNKKIWISTNFNDLTEALKKLHGVWLHGMSSFQNNHSFLKLLTSSCHIVGICDLWPFNAQGKYELQQLCSNFFYMSFVVAEHPEENKAGDKRGAGGHQGFGFSVEGKRPSLSTFHSAHNSI